MGSILLQVLAHGAAHADGFAGISEIESSFSAWILQTFTEYTVFRTLLTILKK